jgi:hypothetical protein
VKVLAAERVRPWSSIRADGAYCRADADLRQKHLDNSADFGEVPAAQERRAALTDNDDLDVSRCRRDEALSRQACPRT